MLIAMFGVYLLTGFICYAVMGAVTIEKRLPWIGDIDGRPIAASFLCLFLWPLIPLIYIRVIMIIDRERRRAIDKGTDPSN